MRSFASALWASWVGALLILHGKLPNAVQSITDDLESECTVGFSKDVINGRDKLLRLGPDLRAWPDNLSEPMPPVVEELVEAFDFARGWQRYACSISEKHFRDRVLWPLSSSSCRALLLPQGICSASAWLRAIPSERSYCIRPLRFQIAIRRRLRWPVSLSLGICCRGCICQLDRLGDRAVACSTSGRLKPRAKPVEKAWARILREAGGRVCEHVALRDTAVPVDPADGRSMEVVATGFPLVPGTLMARFGAGRTACKGAHLTVPCVRRRSPIQNL